jgi:Xaa-Pro aminopeptidase
MDYPARQSKLRALLEKSRLDAFLITHLPNVRYLCGFTGSAGAILIIENKTLFFTDGRYTEQASEEVESAKVVVGKKGHLAAVKEALSKGKNIKLGVEAERLSAAEYSRLRASLPASIKLKPAPSLVEDLRMVKDPEEVDQIRAAVQLGSSLFDGLVNTIRPGVTELQVAAELEYAAAKAGAEGMSFPTIIASGPRSALPHGRASRQVIPANGFVVCDFGVILGGYCSDMTRTLYVGRPSAEAKRFYGAVLDAQVAAVQAVSAGRSEEQVDMAARKLLQKMGLGKYFTHSTGHGVGLEIHEPPRLAKGQKSALKAGMVITAEPGAYIPGKWGVRIEDMVVVTASGCEVLTPTPKELIAI